MKDYEKLAHLRMQNFLSATSLSTEEASEAGERSRLGSSNSSGGKNSGYEDKSVAVSQF